VGYDFFESGLVAYVVRVDEEQSLAGDLACFEVVDLKEEFLSLDKVIVCTLLAQFIIQILPVLLRSRCVR